MLQFHYVQVENEKNWSTNGPIRQSSDLVNPSNSWIPKMAGSTIGSLALTNTKDPRNA